MRPGKAKTRATRICKPRRLRKLKQMVADQRNRRRRHDRSFTDPDPERDPPSRREAPLDWYQVD